MGLPCLHPPFGKVQPPPVLPGFVGHATRICVSFTGLTPHNGGSLGGLARTKAVRRRGSPPIRGASSRCVQAAAAGERTHRARFVSHSHDSASPVSGRRAHAMRALFWPVLLLMAAEMRVGPSSAPSLNDWALFF
ncbi:hypothetical protein HPB50_024532 [Hyalomma asiaticum]|uniref:Uncharacterized protein n=1 Tax=Hyalomma asiaticum TaxID=266040 RepID=A0ACB7SIR0_HYAAI|nr:hypothetical protein HPB50_024532 [Hyalomma asiaticum]